jgi:TRAP-type C4-dicarboxylate transport system permease small subunit
LLNKLKIRFFHLTEFIAAIALAAIFIIFLLQIFTRYAPRISWIIPLPIISDWMNSLQPIGWTVNLISVLWVWIIFFGCSFFVRDGEHVVFDLLVFAVPPKIQKIFLTIVALFMITIMLYSFGPTWDAIFGSRLMELKKIQTLRIPITGEKIPIKWLFAPYIILMIAVICRYSFTLLSLIRLPRLSGKGEDS